LTPTYFDVSPTLRDLARLDAARSDNSANHHLLDDPWVAPESPREAHDADPVAQSMLGPHAMPAPIVTFDAYPNMCSCSPSSASGAVGPSHYVVIGHLHFAVYNKSGALLLGPLSNNTLWAGFGAPCETQNGGQPFVLYDRMADRWILINLNVSSPYSICIAVSTSGDPTGSYYRYSINTGTNRPEGPKPGVGSNAFYIGTREFEGATGPFVGIGAYAMNRAQMLGGDPAPQVISFLVPAGGFQYNSGDGLVPADLDGSVPPPAGSPHAYVGSMDMGGPYGASQDALTMWHFDANFGNPPASTFTLAEVIPVSPFTSVLPSPCPSNRQCIPQPGTTNKLDHGGYRQRVLPRVAYRNFGSHESLVTNQSVDGGGGMSGIRWYEIRDPYGSPFVHQQGTFVPGAFDGIHRWMGSIAMDRSGNIALGYSVSNGTTTFPGIRYTGRLASDPIGSLPQGEGIIVEGTGAQLVSNRWGDYNTMTVDPVDDCTFWYVNQYVPVTSGNGWRIRVGAFKFAECTAVGVEDGEPRPDRTELEVSSPARERVEIWVTLAGAERRRVRLEVFDIAGRRLANLMDDALAGGRYHVTWSGALPAGERAASSVYRVQLTAGSTRVTRSVVLVK
jgi:hypothetical protein